jgi:hypothetical protein
MLNIYLAFSQFLIIWSGNLPEEIPWYLDRIRGHWGVIITLDFIFHWLIPVHAAAVARHQAQQEAADAGVPMDDLCQGLRSVLAD